MVSEPVPEMTEPKLPSSTWLKVKAALLTMLPVPKLPVLPMRLPAEIVRPPLKVFTPLNVSAPAPSLVSDPVPEMIPPSAKSPPLVLIFMSSQSPRAPDQPVFRFSVSINAPEPPLSEVTPARDTPEAMFSVSLPSPRAMLPVTTAPASIVTTALPTPSTIAAPEVAVTLEVDSRRIATAPPALDWVERPAPLPPATAPETVTDNAPVPLLRA